MDIQPSTIHRLGEAAGALTNRIVHAITAARAASIPVIYVVVGFRKGFPETSPANKFFGALRTGAYPGLEEPIQIDPAVTPQPGEIIVTKRRISAFTGSDLEVVLRAQNIHHLVLTGISTSGVVLSTTREAADKDFQLTILSDGCADLDTEVHQLLMSRVFPRQAEVVTAGKWAATL